MRILLTGATGFLGSHIVESLLAHGHELLLTKRNESNMWRCESFYNNVIWVNIDKLDWENSVIQFYPDIIINSAWEGVSAKNRDEWVTQVKNIIFQQQLLDLAKKVNLKKIIGIGSQAEYGEFNGCIDEAHSTNPNTAYGSTKLAASIILKTFCEQNNIHWYWFRLFSCFGERESETWLIPSTIKNMLTKNEMDLTPGEQEYSYMYIKDVAEIFTSAINSNAENGIYNIAAYQRRSLKEILTVIKEYLNPEFQLNFGALPYRKGQSMVNGSCVNKYEHAFGKTTSNDFNNKLIRTIEYYKEKYINEKE